MLQARDYPSDATTNVGTTRSALLPVVDRSRISIDPFGSCRRGDSTRVELMSADSNSVILRNRETSVKYWLRLTNMAPFAITPERIGLKWHITLGDRVQEGTKDVIDPFETLGPARFQQVGVDLSLDPWVGDAAPLARLAAVGSVVATAPELGGRVKDSIGSFVYGRVADSRAPDISGA
jgi:hypothetical protein